MNSQYIATFKHKTKIFYNKVEEFLNNNSILVIIAILVIGALIIISRRPDSILNPQFWGEDGTKWYADGYNNGLKGIFQPYAGYLVVIYRLIGWLTAKFIRLNHAPLIFNFVSLCFQLLPIVIINSKRFTKRLGSSVAAIILSLLYVSIPNSAEVFINLTNIQWHLGITSLLVLISEEDNRLGWRIFDITVLALTGLCGPLIIFLTPVAYFTWRLGKSLIQKIKLLLVATLGVLQLITIFFISHADRVGHENQITAYKFIRMVSSQVVAGGLFGMNAIKTVNSSFLLTILLFVVWLAMLIYIFIKGQAWIKLANVFALLILISMLFSLKPLPGVDLWSAIAMPGSGQRYWYIPIFIMYMDLIWLTVNNKQLKVKLLCAIVLLLSIIGVSNDWHIPAHTDFNFKGYYQVYLNANKGDIVKIPINPGGEDWVIVLHKH